MKLLPKHLISALEATMDRATISGMRQASNVGREESGTARFSVQSKLRFLDVAALHVGARAAGEHVQELFEDRSPSSNGSPFDLTNAYRLRGTDVDRNGKVARRRTFGSNQDFSSRGADPTDNQPAYIFEGATLEVIGSDTNNTSSTASFIVGPFTTPSTDSSISLSGGDLQSDVYDEKHEQTTTFLINTGSNTRYHGIVTDHSNDTVDTEAPDGTYDVVYFDHACTHLNIRHEGAVVELAAAFAFASLGEVGENGSFQSALSNYQEEISQYLAPAFDLREQGSE